MAAKKSDTQFMSECKQIEETRGIILVDGQSYQGTHHYYQWRCAHDGHVWEAPFIRILKDKGCPICGAKRAGSKNAVTEQEFKQRLIERNENYYPTVSYISGYTGSTKKCLVECDSCGNQWETLPKTLYKGNGCPACARKKVVESHVYSLADVKRLIDQRNDKLPNKRVYIVDTSFVSYGQPAEFTCDRGHNWSTKLDNVINAEAGCPHCAGSIQRNTEQSLAEIKAKHPLIKIISLLGTSLGRREEFEAECEHGHRWITNYERLLINGNYCPHCANRAKYTQEQFEEIVANMKSKVRVIGRYDGMNKKIKVQCNECDHIWYTTAQQIASGGGCPMCARNNTYSKMSIEWLTEIEQQQGIKIDHAVSGGEFRIPGTRYRVDGYHKESNTVYEFHGDYWHGNPKKHDPDEYNTVTECTFGELYERTLKKEADIRNLGYNLVVMWESEYNNQRECVDNHESTEV